MSVSNDVRIPMIPPVQVETMVSILAETEDYNHRLMNIPAMWRQTQGEGVKVVILDSGMPQHVDLAPAGGKSFVPGYSIDACGHSTHVGGIIAAIANNNMGVKGIAPACDDYYGTVLDETGAGTIQWIIDGIRWAVDEIGANIINLSLGLPANIPTVYMLEAACRYAVNSGVAVFAAAGNEYGAVGQPAVYDCVYSVGAIDSRLKHAPFSNKGKVDFAAGGVNVFSTYLKNAYARLSGTSMACPALVGAATLILSDARNGDNPRKLTPAELGDKLRKIAFDIGPTGVDTEMGAGIPVFYSSGNITPEPITPGRPWWHKLLPWNWFRKMD